MADSARAPRALPWLLAAAGFAFDLAAYWPGQMSFDSAYAWWQARGGTTSDLTAPALVLLWRACRTLMDGPGLPFALHLALFWGGLALLARTLRCRPLATAATMLLVAFAPLPLVLRGHLWSDVGLLAALTAATAALACAEVERRRRWLLGALPLLFYAAALRHNAWPALLPFVAWWGWLAVQAPAWSAGRPLASPAPAGRTALTALALLAALALGVHALNARVERHVPVWPSLAQYDLAAISIASGRMHLPDFMIGAGLDVAELARAFRPWSNVPMLQNTQHGLRDPFTPEFSQAERDALRTAWLAAIADEPAAWLAHRWRLTRGLFGTHRPDWPRELIYVDAEVPYRDNPPIARNDGALHAALMRAMEAARATPVLAAWPYLLAGLAALPAAWRRRHTPAGRIALLLLASAWLYAAPLTLLAPAAERRYLGWPCVASLLALACAWFAPRSATRC